MTLFPRFHVAKLEECNPRDFVYFSGDGGTLGLIGTQGDSRLITTFQYGKPPIFSRPAPSRRCIKLLDELELKVDIQRMTMGAGGIADKAGVLSLLGDRWIVTALPDQPFRENYDEEQIDLKTGEFLGDVDTARLCTAASWSIGIPANAYQPFQPLYKFSLPQ